MATAQPKSGVTEYTISTGTGALTLTGPAPGFRGFVSADDGLIFHYAIFQDQVAFETGTGTYTHSSRQLSRTIIKGNINGTTTPLNLGAGTKEVSITIPGELVAMHDVNNQFTVDQFFNAASIHLDVDHDTWICANTDDVVQIFQNSIETVRIDGGLGQVTITGTDASATEGPNLLLRRASTSPAVNDALGALYMQGSISGTQQNAAKIRPTWTAVGAGTFSSVLDFAVAGSGALQTVFKLYPNVVSVPAGIVLFSAGKLSSSLTTLGAELLTNGSAQIVCLDGNVPLRIGKAAGNGTYMELYDNGVLNASVTNSSGTTTWGAFTGNHYGDFQAGVSSEHDRLGTVLAATGNLLSETATDPFYELVPAVDGDRRVLGVWGGRQRTAIMGGEARDLIVLFALGNGRIRATGPIAAGDLLWASATPGVAEAQPDQDRIGPWTVAKATNDSPEDGDERLVSCIYMAG